MEIAQQAPPAAAVKGSGAELTIVKCECCELQEECTKTYVESVRDRYLGWWICGLCADAVNEEIERSKERVETKEALNRHWSFRKSFRDLSPPKNPTEELISAVRQLILRSLDSPRSGAGNPESRFPPLES